MFILVSVHVVKDIKNNSEIESNFQVIVTLRHKEMKADVDEIL